MWKRWLFVVLSGLSLLSTPVAEACGPHGCGGTNVQVRARLGVGVSGGLRPWCRIGNLHPGCVAPVRKGLRAAGRVGLGIARGVGRIAVGAGRGIAGAGRLVGRALFGRRFRG